MKIVCLNNCFSFYLIVYWKTKRYMNCHQLWPIPEHNALTNLKIYSTDPNCQIVEKFDILKENIHKIYQLGFELCTSVWPSSIKYFPWWRMRRECLLQKISGICIQFKKTSKEIQKSSSQCSHSESKRDNVFSYFNLSWFISILMCYCYEFGADVVDWYILWQNWLDLHWLLHAKEKQSPLQLQFQRDH